MNENEKEVKWEDNIKKWINEQPLWVHMATKNYLSNKKMDNKEIKNIADACIKDIDKLNEENSKIKNKENINIDSILANSNSEKFCIKEISNVVGVDALSNNQKLEFEPKGITVVYGDNGSGKSGYIRILKKISNSLYKEEIKSNIYNDKSEEQKCKVRIEKDGIDEEIECDLRKDKIYAQLKNIDIFDTKTSKGYTDDEKEPNFEPQILKFLEFLGEISEKLKKEIEGRRVELKQYLIDENYKNNEEIKKIDQIDEKTDVNRIVAKFTDEDEKELKVLNEKLLNREKDIKLIDYKIGVIDETIDYFEKFKKFYSNENLEEIENSKTKVLDKIKIKNDFNIKIGKDLNDEDKNHLKVILGKKCGNTQGNVTMNWLMKQEVSIQPIKNVHYAIKKFKIKT